MFLKKGSGVTLSLSLIPLKIALLYFCLMPSELAAKPFGHCFNSPILTLWHPSKMTTVSIPGRSGSSQKIRVLAPDLSRAVQSTYWEDFHSTFIDTFYQDTLENLLALKIKSNAHIIIGEVDSVRTFLALDSAWSKTNPDTLQGERVWLTIHEQLKGSIPETKLTFAFEKFTYWSNNPFATTYTALIGLRFVGFFNNTSDLWDRIADGFGPLDGCYFEPTAFLIKNNAIYRTGLIDQRMPGVSVPYDRFLKLLHSSDPMDKNFQSWHSEPNETLQYSIYTVDGRLLRQNPLLSKGGLLEGYLGESPIAKGPLILKPTGSGSKFQAAMIDFRKVHHQPKP